MYVSKGGNKALQSSEFIVVAVFFLVCLFLFCFCFLFFRFPCFVLLAEHSFPVEANIEYLAAVDNDVGHI